MRILRKTQSSTSIQLWRVAGNSRLQLTVKPFHETVSSGMVCFVCLTGLTNRRSKLLKCVLDKLSIVLMCSKQLKRTIYTKTNAEVQFWVIKSGSGYASSQCVNQSTILRRCLYPEQRTVRLIQYECDENEKMEGWNSQWCSHWKHYSHSFVHCLKYLRMPRQTYFSINNLTLTHIKWKLR